MRQLGLGEWGAAIVAAALAAVVTVLFSWVGVNPGIPATSAEVLERLTKEGIWFDSAGVTERNDQSRRTAVTSGGRKPRVQEGTQRPEVLAKTIAAFANAHGGRLVIGVEENPQRVVGVRELRAAEEAIHTAAEMVTPRPELQLESLSADDHKQVLVAHVAEGQDPPYLALGQAVTRIGNRIVAMSRTNLAGLFRQTAGIFSGAL